MGAWGFEPWEDDLAADWFGDLFRQGKIAERVEKALRRKDVEEYWPEIRAAAHVITVLGDVWPSDLLREHSELAITALEAVKHTSEFEGDAVMATEIDAQIDVLKNRIPDSSSKTDRLAAKYAPDKALAELTSPDAKVRKDSVLWLQKQAFAGANVFTEDWLKEPKTTESLLPLLDDPDPEVAQQAITTIRGIMSRYYRTPRALPGALKLVRSERPQARMNAGLVALEFGEECLDEVLPLFKDREKFVRAAVISEAGSQSWKWSAPAKGKLREAALAALTDRAGEVRLNAAELLAVVGSRDDLPAIEKAKAATKGAGFQSGFAEAIKDLKKRK